MRKSLLTNILAQCRAELTKHPQYEHFPHWTFIVIDNKIISVGVNRSAEPSKHYGYHVRQDSPTFRPKWHSELDAIHRCNHRLHGCIAVNVRLNRNNETRMAFPCRPCRNILKVVNCSKIYFTSDTVGSVWESYKQGR